jgi:hypothetical protein
MLEEVYSFTTEPKFYTLASATILETSKKLLGLYPVF